MSDDFENRLAAWIHWVKRNPINEGQLDLARDVDELKCELMLAREQCDRAKSENEKLREALKKIVHEDQLHLDMYLRAYKQEPYFIGIGVKTYINDASERIAQLRILLNESGERIAQLRTLANGSEK
jgi:hypothetical protein